MFASHQIGAALAALGAGVIRDNFGTYTYAWWGGAALCVIAAVLSITIRRELVSQKVRRRAVVTEPDDGVPPTM